MESNLQFISKITQNANSDLREYTAHVKKDLVQLQNQSVVEISQLKSEVQTLQNQIDTSIGVLDKIANIVGTFQTDLENISTQVLSLQSQSNQMSVSHKNRKLLYEGKNWMDFQKAYQSLPLTSNTQEKPKLTRSTSKRQISLIKSQRIQKIQLLQNQNKVTLQQLSKLVRLLLFSSQYLISGPQIEKVNSAVCTRIRNLFIQKFQTLSKPKTNISMIQQSILKFTPLMIYLRTHNQYTYVELTNIYSQTMHKIYFTLLKSYITDSAKVIAEVVTQHDLIGVNGNSEDPAGINSLSNYSKGLKERTLFCDGNKNENILYYIESDPIVLHNSSSNKQKHKIQEIFLSQNRLIINTITSQLIFIGDFFALQVQQCSHMFKIIFNRIVTFYVDWLKTYVQFSCHDCTGLLLMTLINECNKERLEQSKFPVLQFYFDKISQVIQPRFNAVFQNQMLSLKKSSSFIQTTIQKQMSKAGVGGRITSIAPNIILPFIQRYVEFVIPLYYLMSFASQAQGSNINNELLVGGFNGEMMNLRLNQIKGLVLESLHQIAGKVFKHDKNVATIFVINNVNFIKEGFSKVKSQKLMEIVRQMTRQNEQKMDGFISALVGGYFHDLQGIVRKFGGNALNDSGSDSGGRASLEKKSDDQDEEDNGPFEKKSQKIGEAQIKQFDQVNLQFQMNWKSIMQQIEDYLQKTVASGNQIDKIILRRVAKQIFRNYTLFADLMKSVRPIADMSVMQAQKSILVELKNYERQIK